MPAYAQTLTYLLALGTVGMQLAVLAALVYRIARGQWLPTAFRAPIARYGLAVAALLPIMAFFMSLWYSEIIGLPVCVLCWFGRVFMYPLAVVLPIAAYRRDVSIVPYALALSVAGMLVTGYHHFYQVGLAPGALCDALAGGSDCMTRYVFELGFVTMPLMGFTLFAAVTLLLWIVRSELTRG